MKKIFLAVAAMAMLATACTKDDATVVSNESLVSFSVSSPELQTRAYGDGAEATVLHYAFYDEGNNLLNAISAIGEADAETQSVTLVNGKATINVHLVEGRTYSAIFWASAPDAAEVYDVNWDARTVEMATELTANNEDYDAFYSYTIGIDPAKKTHKIELTRPFAQLNIATKDLAAAVAAGVDVKATKVTVDAYNKLKFAVKEIDGVNTGVAEVEGDKVAFTYDWAPVITNEKVMTDYDLISMNYVLVDARTLVNVSLRMSETYTDGQDDAATDIVRNYTTVPVQRNYRTYIVGNLLTTTNEFEVETKPGFEDDKENVESSEVWDGETLDKPELVDGVYSVSHAAEFAWILANAEGAKISLECDINFGGHEIPAWDKSGHQIGHNVELEGNGFTIYNFASTHSSVRSASDQVVALFDIVTNAKVSNLAIEGATVDAGKGKSAYAGVLFGSTYGTIELNNVTVKNSTIKGTNKIGAFIGNVTEGRVIASNCYAIDNTLETYDFTSDEGPESGSAGGFIGYINQNSNTFTNCSVEGGKMTFINGVQAAKRANSKFIGVISGSGTITLNNCSVNVEDYTDNCGSYVSPYGDFVGGNRSTAKVVINGATYVNSAAALTAALTADDEEISIILGTDATIDITAWDDKPMGGQNTKKITIDGNGYTLTFNQTNSDWANVFSYGKLTLKNMTINKSGYGTNGGAWNTHVIMFNCDVELDNVTINHSTGVEKNATLKNVTITEDEGFYSLWITANGQTVDIDGLTINATNGGRGIKVADQYVDAPASVTLNVANSTFTTAAKAAVLVSSEAGAVVNWGEGNEISKVSADTEFAVWVDEDWADYADKVVVNGALVKVEGSADAVVESNDALAEALKNGASSVYLAAGTYNMPSTGGNDITIVGSKDVVINAGASNMGSGNVTLKGVTITAGSYKGFQHSGVVTYNDVTIQGQLNCYGEKDIFTNCTFELDNTYVWTYGSNETIFDGCTFNTTGKAILIYNEGAGACNVTVKNCTFNATAGAKAGAIANQNCAAIEIDNYAKMPHVLTTSGNTYSENFSGEWRIKSYVAGAPVTVNDVEYTQIAVDGKLMTIDADKNVTVQ